MFQNQEVSLFVYKIRDVHITLLFKIHKKFSFPEP